MCSVRENSTHKKVIVKEIHSDRLLPSGFLITPDVRQSHERQSDSQCSCWLSTCRNSNLYYRKTFNEKQRSDQSKSQTLQYTLLSIPPCPLCPHKNAPAGRRSLCPSGSNIPENQ